MPSTEENKKHELVTIGLTCFNAENTISTAIDCAIQQTWPNTEILIVDDCSVDNSINIINEKISEYENARVILHKENKGRACARNSILENAKGEFIAFFDDDDESFPERVEKQVKKILEYETKTQAKYVTCCASGTRCYSNGYSIDMKAIGSVEEVPVGTGLADYLLFYKRIPGWFYGGGVPTCALLARRNVFEAVGGFEEGMRSVEDTDLAIRLAFLGCHFIGTKEKLFKQHVTFSQDKSPDVNLKSEQYLADKNADYLRSINRYYYAKQWPKLRYYHFKRQYIALMIVLIKLCIRHPVAVPLHLFSTGPKRLLHESRMQH